MRCPHCEIPNEDGAAVCSSCGTPLTAYGNQITGEVSEATRARAAKLAIRPAVVPFAAAFCAFAAVAGPLWRVMSLFLSRVTTNPEGTNYLSAAFGAVGIAFSAMVLVPLAIALLLVAWGVMTQRTWAWGAVLALLFLVLVTAFRGYFFGPILRLPMIIGSIA